VMESFGKRLRGTGDEEWRRVKREREAAVRELEMLIGNKRLVVRIPIVQPQRNY